MAMATTYTDVSSSLVRSFERVSEGVAVHTSSGLEHCKVFAFGDYVTAEAGVPARHVGIGDLVAQWEAVPERREAIARARGWVVDAFHADEGETLRTLRLKKGFSQQQLAGAIGTCQADIARMERGADDLSIGTCRKLADALGIDMNALDAALQRQKVVANGLRMARTIDKPRDLQQHP